MPIHIVCDVLFALAKQIFSCYDDFHIQAVMGRSGAYLFTESHLQAERMAEEPARVTPEPDGESRPPARVMRIREVSYDQLGGTTEALFRPMG